MYQTIVMIFGGVLLFLGIIAGAFFLNDQPFITGPVIDANSDYNSMILCPDINGNFYMYDINDMNKVIK